jgi:uncharacterized phosphosugar-binding protein
MAGKDITKYIQTELRERGEYVPPEDSLNIAKHIKVGAYVDVFGCGRCFVVVLCVFY